MWWKVRIYKPRYVKSTELFAVSEKKTGNHGATSSALSNSSDIILAKSNISRRTENDLGVCLNSMM